ncbi:MAG: AMP-binding protein, partial [Chloroflexi bacterium]|nr:AMP-binding protein [Chloroflexota bacterium]
EEIQQSIPQRFERIAARFADHLALKSPGYELTYQKLNRLANQIAHLLLTELTNEPQPILLYCQHDVPAIIGVLGVLKAGKFYICLDPQHPQAVNQQIIAEINPVYILADQATIAVAEQLAPPGIRVVNIEAINEQLLPTENPNQIIAPSALAYVTFTSGSTGQPKGVMEDHQDVLHYVGLFTNYFHTCPEDRVLTVNRLSTAGAWVSLYPGLLNGASVFLFDVQQTGSGALAQWIAQEQITVMTMTVSLFRELAPVLPAKEQLHHLRMVGLGGEPIRTDDITRYQECCPAHTILRIAFGASEAHFISCYYLDKQSPLITGPIPTGYPTGDAEILILDEQGVEVANGEIGEIVVRRTYLTAGYWGNPSLTAARYQAPAAPGAKRLYRLGDRGYKQPDGCLVHMGRVDNQVKIRGQFVDLNGLETILSQLGDVEQAVVTVHQEDQKSPYLVAYIKLQVHSQETLTSLYQRLANRLPSHMLPRSIVLVDRFPIAVSGKIDRRALPKPDTSRPALATAYAPPRTALEQHLVALWQEVLNITPIGIEDNFLELGGDSLRAMLLMNRLYSLSGSFIYIRILFEAPTIAAFSQVLMLHYPAIAQNLTHTAANAWPETLPRSSHIKQELDEATLQQIRTWLAVLRCEPTCVASGPVSRNPSAVFVLSPPRSGSTLLRVLLAGHPQLFAPQELSLLSFNTLQERHAALNEPGSGLLTGAIRAIMAAQNCDVETAEAWMAQMEAANLTTQAFYQQLQTWIQPRCLVDKTPTYAYGLETLRQAEQKFDQPRYIHLVRHPLGMINSYVKNKSDLSFFAHLRYLAPNAALPSLLQPAFAPEVLGEAIWLIAQQNIRTFLAEIPPQRQLVVHFEALVHQPEIVLTQICAFLGLAFDPAMRQPYAEKTIRMTDGINESNKMVGDIKFHQHTTIDPTVADHWKAAYTTDFLSDMTWETAEHLGYKRPSLPAAVPEKALQAGPYNFLNMEQMMNHLDTLSEEEAHYILMKKEF